MRAQWREVLRQAVGNPAADFHPGQWEAMDALVNQRKKLLVVERTGWGKSLVYFLSAKMMREKGMGPTIIISPLLALMRNQIESARRFGVTAASINSTNVEEWDAVAIRLYRDEIDCLLISPERLANDSFIDRVLNPIISRIAMLVIDEAHCISDWGHDFRPDYQRIAHILLSMSANTPVLCTTATANDRVVADIRAQIGDIEVQRGALVRDNLYLQALILPDQASRLAWLAQIIPRLHNPGIIYALTTQDCENVAGWLRENGIRAEAYYGNMNHPGFSDGNAYRTYLENLLYQRKLHVLVATNALGMGYDQPDLGFICHYQMPASVIAYYQQVGRAGRGIARAACVLMSGMEDGQIHEYFRLNAFPPERDIQEVLAALEQSDGLDIEEMEAQCNLRRKQIEKVIKSLRVDNPAPIIKVGNKWHRTVNHYTMDRVRIARLTAQREKEWAQMQDYLHSTDCRMQYLRHALDDKSDDTPCGKCDNCCKKPPLPTQINHLLVERAETYLRNFIIPIKPHKQLVGELLHYGHLPATLDSLVAAEGRVLARWNDAGWGKQVTDGKHSGYFNDALVDAMAEMITRRWRPIPAPRWVCCIPSLRHPALVPDFARRLAARLNLPYIDALHKVRDNPPQKEQNNSYHQCANLDGVFAVAAGIPHTPVLLIDDITDSGWTFTIAAALLRQAGSGVVYPAALATSANKD
ncbi:ATP-dependent DNA helicase, RecQ family [Cardiobacterium valvarum F0432]|uniref:ATP-dependent DNA helicase RecQ n=2 Tax=Cardiobacterium valvarum TaxID=194702 RepID=G9ZC73_9GAMM|nr:RecQ family ATP-dependent DNA helicase [Cardiobacterium valvarum]EHM55846.1 ATP-dependent DNA helicase, RecQ family [Cardiobacterium valvarum F0432]